MMRRAGIATLIVASLVAAAVVWAPQAFAQPAPSAAASAPLSGRALVDALRRGGYVIYLRHTSTDFGQNDDAMTTFDDCAKQRNLTDAGRAEARAIGAAIAKLRIPIGDVLASPYCRTLETARLAFGRATAAPAARGGPAVPESADRYDALRALLSASVKNGVNAVIVSHGNPFRAVAGPPYLAEGEAAVIEPLGARGFRIVARVTRESWALLDPG
jgi:phosphohistidine phosphatase SixA